MLETGRDRSPVGVAADPRRHIPVRVIADAKLAV
jgi:hypothetical protein